MHVVSTARTRHTSRYRSRSQPHPLLTSLNILVTHLSMVQNRLYQTQSRQAFIIPSPLSKQNPQRRTLVLSRHYRRRMMMHLMYLSASTETNHKFTQKTTFPRNPKSKHQKPPLTSLGPLTKFTQHRSLSEDTRSRQQHCQRGMFRLKFLLSSQQRQRLFPSSEPFSWFLLLHHYATACNFPTTYYRCISYIYHNYYGMYLYRYCISLSLSLFFITLLLF